jgi:hypothetical protein
VERLGLRQQRRQRAARRPGAGGDRETGAQQQDAREPGPATPSGAVALDRPGDRGHARQRCELRPDLEAQQPCGDTEAADREREPPSAARMARERAAGACEAERQQRETGHGRDQ